MFVGNDIITDFLSVINIEEAVCSSRVNLSYSFEALEFKRLVNNFDISEIEPALDSALQQFISPFGQYSFIPEKQYTQQLAEVSKQLQELVDSYGQTQLASLIESIKRTAQGKVIEQTATLVQLTEVVEFLKQQKPLLFHKLLEKINSHQNLMVDNSNIYVAFDVPHQAFNFNEPCSQLLATMEALQVAEQNKGLVAFHLSKHFLATDEPTQALNFAMVAKKLKPQHVAISQHLNRVLIINNDKQEAKLGQSQLIYKGEKSTFVEKLKKLVTLINKRYIHVNR